MRVERDGDHGVASRVVYRPTAAKQAIDCDVVLSTLPLPALVNMTSPPLPRR